MAKGSRSQGAGVIGRPGKFERVDPVEGALRREGRADEEAKRVPICGVLEWRLETSGSCDSPSYRLQRRK
ncbi:hypothetical protein JCM24511_06686 [Saitozyma sp. JCM 24511]|nr:hypothetical protein JCM24511_06686 [Saitozyma sp. JCM 24511]